MNRIELEDIAQRVRRGEKVKLSRKQIGELQDHALNIKDIELYDKLEKYWKKFGKQKDSSV